MLALLACAQSSEILGTTFFFDSHPIPPKPFKLRLTSSKSVKLRSAIMTSQRRRQLKLTPVAAAVAAVDERRRQRQQVNNQRSRVIKKSEFTEKPDRFINEKA
jgi:hypothetical protein